METDRMFTPELRLRATMEAWRERLLKDGLLRKWRTQSAENAAQAFEQRDRSSKKARIAELQRTVARLAMGIEILRGGHHTDACGPGREQITKLHRGWRSRLANPGDERAGAPRPGMSRLIKKEDVRLSGYDGYADAGSPIGAFLDGVYRHMRIH